jgi:hypothetical protein
MKNSNKLEKEVALRNITDYIFSCIERLSDNASLIFYLGNNKKRFFDKDSKSTIPIIISMVDVYSRDSVIVLNTILDKDSRTSSLFTLLKYVRDKKTREEYAVRLKSIKLSVQNVIKGRNTMVAHFNTDLNTIDNDRFHIIVPVEFDPRYLNRISKDIKKMFWDLKEELSVEGLFGCYRGSISRSFAELIGKEKK